MSPEVDGTQLASAPVLVVEHTFLHFKEQHEFCLTRHRSAPAELTSRPRLSQSELGASMAPPPSVSIVASPPAYSAVERLRAPMAASADPQMRMMAHNSINDICPSVLPDSIVDLQKKALPHNLDVIGPYVFWTVEAKKLKSGDRGTVSPPFFLHGAQVKIMMQPKITSEGKGGSSFRNSRGNGLLQLKCESNVQKGTSFLVKFNVAVGSDKDKMATARGPIEHDFSNTAVAGLPEDLEVWNFNDWVNPASSTFVVCLEFLS